MSREIKFRAWNHLVKKFFYGKELSVHFHDSGVMYAIFYDSEGNEAHVPLHEFTGLTDDNGVEIYEGDILYVDSENLWEGRYLVEFKIVGNEEYFTFQQLQINLIKDLTNKEVVEKKHIEAVDNLIEELEWGGRKIGIKVTGNIYMNPELLEATS